MLPGVSHTPRGGEVCEEVCEGQRECPQLAWEQAGKTPQGEGEVSTQEVTKRSSGKALCFLVSHYWKVSRWARASCGTHFQGMAVL